MIRVVSCSWRLRRRRRQLEDDRIEFYFTLCYVIFIYLFISVCVCVCLFWRCLFLYFFFIFCSTSGPRKRAKDVRSLLVDPLGCPVKRLKRTQRTSCCRPTDLGPQFRALEASDLGGRTLNGCCANKVAASGGSNLSLPDSAPAFPMTTIERRARRRTSR